MTTSSVNISPGGVGADGRGGAGIGAETPNGCTLETSPASLEKTPSMSAFDCSRESRGVIHGGVRGGVGDGV